MFAKTASLLETHPQDAHNHLMNGFASLGAVAAIGLSDDHGGSDSAFGSVVGCITSGDVQKVNINAVLNPVCDPAISVTIRIHRSVARSVTDHLRVVCIEDTRELELAAQDKAYLVTVQQSDGTRAINQQQLVADMVFRSRW